MEFEILTSDVVIEKPNRKSEKSIRGKMLPGFADIGAGTETKDFTEVCCQS